MAFYDNNNDTSWSAPGRQPSWEQQPPPSRSGTGSAMSNPPDSNAFASQFEEIDRATDNLMKSGKWYPGQAAGSPAAAGPSRRESVPTAGRNFDYGADARSSGGPPSRHQSVSEFDGGRPGSAGLQGFYQGQRFPGGRQSEAEQVLQAKRRMAAQRERELRNYHQEQQYNRKAVSGGKQQDRSLSPATMSEEDRRELIARQHRALYGDNSNLYTPGSTEGSRTPSQDVRVPSGGRGPSPLAYDPYQAQSGAEGAVQMPPRDRVESTASPASNAPPQQFGLLNDAQQSSRTSNSSQGGSPPLGAGSKGNSGVAPIGTRPAQASGPASALNKRSTTPLTPSSLSYGFNVSDAQNANNGKDDRSTSAASSNPALAEKSNTGLGNWAAGNGGWGSGKTNLAVQPSVWG